MPTPPVDPYEAQTYRILMQRGLSHVEAIKKAAFWGALKRSDPTGNTVTGPADYAADLAQIDAKHNGSPQIITDAISGQTSYIGSFQTPAPPTAAITGSGSSIGSPPTLLEYNRSQWIGMRSPVDRFSLNPASDYYAAIPGPAPEMFGTGPLPLISGSGVDPSVLRWVCWQLRTSAAYAESRAQVLGFIELSMQGDPDGFEGHVTALGGQALKEYWGRVGTWVATPVDANAPLTESDYSQFYPDAGDNA
jgi:hypothetical protein